MIDIHSHILWGIDDGPKTIEESIEMVQMALEDGIHTIIATPHFIPGSYDTSGHVVLEKVSMLNDFLRLRKIPVKILSGQEIYLDLKTEERLASGENLTLAGTKYILIEFPMAEIPYYADQAIYKLSLKGYQPIIAHPERIHEVIKDPTALLPLIHKGCLLQVNSLSLEGGFGSRVKRTAEKLVRNHMVHLIGSDAHNVESRKPQLRNALSRIKNLTSQDHSGMFIYRSRQVIKDEMTNWVEPATENEIEKSAFRRFGSKVGVFW
jgi:protein-tyrosine phosphatase